MNVSRIFIFSSTGHQAANEGPIEAISSFSHSVSSSAALSGPGPVVASNGSTDGGSSHITSHTDHWSLSDYIFLPQWFDFGGALTSFMWMAGVLVTVLTPMILIILIVVLSRVISKCSNKCRKKNASDRGEEEEQQHQEATASSHVLVVRGEEANSGIQMPSFSSPSPFFSRTAAQCTKGPSYVDY
ncbi:hypothetical protein HDE_10759 [Halotydeus destructor]|nr:hypothetical protein HDE_10759 [Halotydeus destructor]